MIRRIVVIFISVLLQLVATACSAQRQSTHTVCPEASMTLSSGCDGKHSSSISLADGVNDAVAIVCHSGYEAFASQSQSQARLNGWQWQRTMRCDMKRLLSGIGSLHAVMSIAHSRTFGIDTQSTGYVFVIRHIII